MKQFLFILATLLLYPERLPGQAVPIQKIDGSYTSSIEMEEIVGRLMDTAKVTGLGLAIFNNNKIVFQKAFGFSNAATKDSLDSNSIIYGASLSKAVFSVLVMQLVEEGVIDLDVPLQTYLKKPLPDYIFNKSWKGYHHLKGDKRYEKITARMCLTHTTGFPNWRFLTGNEFDKDGKLYFKFEPEERYFYSGEGFSLLQFVLEQITGNGLEEMAQERIFRPLGMERTSFIYILREEFEDQYAYGHDEFQNVIPFDQADGAGAAGSMGTTLVDYSKFLTAVLNNKMLQEDTNNEIFKQQVAIRSKQQFGPNALVETGEYEDISLGYGLGWGVLETPYGSGAFKEGHSEGFQHYSIIFLKQE